MRAALLSFRLGCADGVSVAADALGSSLADLGYEVVTVAGEGRAHRIVAGLSRSAGAGPDPVALRSALADTDLVVVENLLTLPLHPPATHEVAKLLAGRPTLVRHHDPPWHRERFAHLTDPLPDDPTWQHAAVCDRTRDELTARGLDASTLHVGLRPPGRVTNRRAVRRLLGVGRDEILCLHPVRAVARKEIPTALDLTRRLGGAYWLTGPAEESYEAQARAHLASAGIRTIWRSFDDLGVDSGVDDAYAAADLVLFPSSREGFGIPPLEAALRRRLAVVGDYPAAAEFREMGIRWPTGSDIAEVRRLLADDVARMRLLDQNLNIVTQTFSQAATTVRLRSLLDARGWLQRTPARSGTQAV